VEKMSYNYKEKICVECGISFKPNSGHQKACTACKEIHKKRVQQKYNKKHLVRIREQKREWREKNRERYNELSRNWSERMRWKYIQELNGKCSKCRVVATKDNMIIFDFHHINPEEKESAHEYRSKKFDTSKIKLLCSNCHRLEHYRNFEEDNNE